jgi:hypothetical protein
MKLNKVYNQIGRLFQLLAKQTEKYDTIYYRSDVKHLLQRILIMEKFALVKRGLPSENSMTGKLIKMQSKYILWKRNNCLKKLKLKNEIDELTELKK